MNSTPLVSVISPSYNCVSLIERCINSVRAQTYPRIEHIIVDGASKDGTAEVIASFPHLRWLSEPDKGEAEALNKASRLVTGDIVNWLNVDDLYADPSVVERVVKAFLENPDCGVVYGNAIAVTEDNQVAWYRRPTLDWSLPRLMRWFHNINLPQPAIFYSRKAFDDVGPFREELVYGIDYDHCLRVAARGYQAHFIDRPLAYATLVRSGAKSGAPVEDQHQAWIEIVRPFQNYLTHTERFNYWFDYYMYRIKPPIDYSSPLEAPEEEMELRGFAVAALEHFHFPLCLAAAEKLSVLYPNSADTYWILAEVFYKAGQTERSQQALAKGADILYRSEKLE